MVSGQKRLEKVIGIYNVPAAATATTAATAAATHATDQGRQIVGAPVADKNGFARVCRGLKHEFQQGGRCSTSVRIVDAFQGQQFVRTVHPTDVHFHGTCTQTPVPPVPPHTLQTLQHVQRQRQHRCGLFDQGQQQVGACVQRRAFKCTPHAKGSVFQNGGKLRPPLQPRGNVVLDQHLTRFQGDGGVFSTPVFTQRRQGFQ